MKQILTIVTCGLAAFCLFASQSPAAELKKNVFAYSSVGSMATAV